MPNVFIRFRILAGWPRTILFALWFLFFVGIALAAIVVGDFKSPAIWFLLGLPLGVFLRPLLLVKLSLTAKMLNGFWFVFILYTLLVHKALGKPDWSYCVIFASAGVYLAASFVFYSSTLLYIAGLMVETRVHQTSESEAAR